MSNAMIPADERLPQRYDSEDFGDVSKSVDYYYRIQLCGSNNDLCKEGKVPVGHWALIISKDQFEILGPSIDVLPIAWRPRAMKLESGKNPISYFDNKSEDFLRVKSDSETQPNGNLYGPDYLLWLPQKKMFVTYYMSNKTARRAAPTLHAKLTEGLAATLLIKLFSNTQYKWHGPVVQDCTTPFEVPPFEERQKHGQKFQHPPTKVIEEVAESVETRDR